MDHRDQRHQHKEKERQERIKDEQAHEDEAEKRRLPFHPAWFVVAGFLLTALAVYVWTFRLW